MTAVGSYPMRSDAVELAEMLLWAAGITYLSVPEDAYPSGHTRRMRLLVEDADASDAVALLTEQIR
jgi:hypothetical protein